MSLTQTHVLAVTAVDQTTGPKPMTGGGASVLITGTFSATIALQYRGPTQATGAAWALPTDGWVTLATWTAATVPASDATVNTYPLSGTWDVRLVCTVYASGAPMCWLGVQNQAC